MKRRILLCLLVLCTVLMIAPMATLAVSAESDVVATVTYQGTVLSQAQTLSEAFAAAGKREGATVKLENDVVITAGFAFNGTYTFDLNGHTITAHTPLIQTRGTVTIVDTSSAKTGTIRGLGRPALELRGTAFTTTDENGVETKTYDGNIVLKSGTFDATDCDYAVYNKGQGVLYLTGTPKLLKGVYLNYSDTLCGTDAPKEDEESKGASPYTGEVVSVYYGENPVPENAILLKDGDAEKFDFAQRGFFTSQTVGNTIMYSRWGYMSFVITVAIGFVALLFVFLIIRSICKTNKKIKKMRMIAIPAFLPFMAQMGDMWRLILVGLAALLFISIVMFIVTKILMKKKLKKATAAYEQRLLDDPEFAERKAWEFENSKEGRKLRKKEAKKAAKLAKKNGEVPEEIVEETIVDEVPVEVIESVPVESIEIAPVEVAPVEAEEISIVIEEAPAEEPAPVEVVEEAPVEEPAPVEVVEEAPVEEPAPVEVVEEAPVEELAPVEVVEEAPVEEPAPVEVVEEAPAEEPAPVEVVEEAPVVVVEQAPTVVVEESPVVVVRKDPAAKYNNIPQYDKKAAKKAAKEAKKAAKLAKKNGEQPTVVAVDSDGLTDAQRYALEVENAKLAAKAAKTLAEEESAEEPAPVVIVEEAPVEIVEEAPVEVVEETPVEIVEEAPAEIVEEAPVEVVVEAPVEVVEEDTDENEAEDVKIERAPNVLVSVPVIGADGKATSYTNYKKSFMARIVLSSAEVQERYNVMKNALLSYKKVNARISWSYESIKSTRTQLAKFAIRGKTLCMYLALDPKTLGDSKYNVSDESESKKYDTVPCCLRLTSKRSIKWGLELIEKMATELELVADPKYTSENFVPDAKSDEQLLELGLIKQVQ